MEREYHYPDIIGFEVFEKTSIVNDIKEFVYWYSNWSFGLQQIVDGDRCYLYPISEVVMNEKDHTPRIDHAIRMSHLYSYRIRPRGEG